MKLNNRNFLIFFSNKKIKDSPKIYGGDEYDNKEENISKEKI